MENFPISQNKKENPDGKSEELKDPELKSEDLVDVDFENIKKGKETLTENVLESGFDEVQDSKEQALISKESELLEIAEIEKSIKKLSPDSIDGLGEDIVGKQEGLVSTDDPDSTGMSRRDFLKTSAMAAAGFAMGMGNSRAEASDSSNIEKIEKNEENLDAGRESAEYREFLDDVKNNGAEAIFKANQKERFVNEEVMDAIKEYWKEHFKKEENWHSIKDELLQFQKEFPELNEIFEDKGLPSELSLLSIIESDLDENAVNPSGAFGVWQLMPHELSRYNASHEDISRSKAKTLQGGAEVAANLIKEKLEMFGGDMDLTVLAYNGSMVGNYMERKKDKFVDMYWEQFQNDEDFREKMMAVHDDFKAADRWLKKKIKNPAEKFKSTFELFLNKKSVSEFDEYRDGFHSSLNANEFYEEEEAILQKSDSRKNPRIQNYNYLGRYGAIKDLANEHWVDSGDNPAFQSAN